VPTRTPVPATASTAPSAPASPTSSVTSHGKVAPGPGAVWRPYYHGAAGPG
jgi:hypothetical protein